MTLAIFDPDARAEFLGAVRYYEEARPGLGRRFRLVVESAIESITETPFRYRLLHAPFRRCLLPKFPYAIIFSIEPDHIRIIAVAHAKRKPGFWMAREEKEKEESKKPTDPTGCMAALENCSMKVMAKRSFSGS